MVIELAPCRCAIGELFLALRDGILVGLKFADQAPPLESMLERRFGHVDYADANCSNDGVKKLRDYFAGCLKALESIEVDPGGTAFQRKVWQRLREVPLGTVVSYQEVACAIGAMRAARAVGFADGSGP